MILAIILFSISFIGSFVFAGFETGLVSVNRLKVDHAKSEGDSNAKLLQYLLDHQAQVISTVLIGNNIALVGMQSSFTTLIEPIVPSILIPTLLTVLALIFCELLPKSLFRIYSYKMTLFFTKLIRLLTFIFSPITFLFSLLSKSSSGDEIRGNIVKSELVSIATEGGRNRELNLMIPILAESIFKAEGESLRCFCESLTPLESAEECDLSLKGSDKVEILLKCDLLFSEGVIEVVCEDSADRYRVSVITEKLLYEKL